MRAPAKNAPLHRHVEFFVRWHLGPHEIGRDCFTAFTGQDLAAWRAFVYLVECWCAGGDNEAINAMCATVACAQRRVDILQCFVQVIASVGDWPDVAQLWPRVVGPAPVGKRDGTSIDGRYLCAVERWGDPERITRHGLSVPARAHLEPVP